MSLPRPSAASSYRGHGFAAIFIVSAAVNATACLLSLFLPASRKRDESLADDHDHLSQRKVLQIVRAPHLLPIYAVIVINMFLIGVLFGFLPVSRPAWLWSA